MSQTGFCTIDFNGTYNALMTVENKIVTENEGYSSCVVGYNENKILKLEPCNSYEACNIKLEPTPMKE